MKSIKVPRRFIAIAIAIGCAGAGSAGRQKSLKDAPVDQYELPAAYTDSVREGEAALESGDLDRAEAAFSRASAIDLPEVPNYEMVIRVAEVKCLKRSPDAAKLIRDFACMLDVDEGKKPCFVNVSAGAKTPTLNPELTVGCVERMCGEIYLPYYENQTLEGLAAIGKLRADMQRVQKTCHQRPTQKPASP